MSGFVRVLQNPWPAIGLSIFNALGALRTAWQGLASRLRPMTALIAYERFYGLVLRLIFETGKPVDNRFVLTCNCDDTVKMADLTTSCSAVPRALHEGRLN